MILMENSLKVFSNYAFGTKFITYPLRVQIEATNRCNLSCSICPRREMERPDSDLEISLVRDIVDQTRDYAFDYTLSATGEPLLYKDLFEAIRYIRSGNKFCCLFSNISFLNGKTNDSLIRSGLNKIIVTVPSLDKDRYESVKKGSSFEKDMDNLRNLVMMKKRLRSGLPNIVLQVIDFGNNKDEIREFEGYFHSWPVFTLVRNFDNWAGAVKVADDEERFCGKPKGRCTQLWTTAVILSNGDLTSCCQDYEGINNFGSVSKKGIVDIWNSDGLNRFRETHQQDRSCRQCINWNREFSSGLVFAHLYSYFFYRR